MRLVRDVQEVEEGGRGGRRKQEGRGEHLPVVCGQRSFLSRAAVIRQQPERVWR